ncbi:hypothetical protein Sjap_010684 [Stephania japonica]|uniref:Uncharacterized protein n=1 Tax=Stephania japonica TaxID=461633 RepID=A0AAP0J9M0_9MAGN
MGKKRRKNNIIKEQPNKYYFIIHSQQIVLEADSMLQMIMEKLQSYISRALVRFEVCFDRLYDKRLWPLGSLYIPIHSGSVRCYDESIVSNHFLGFLVLGQIETLKMENLKESPKRSEAEQNEGIHGPGCCDQRREILYLMTPLVSLGRN